MESKGFKIKLKKIFYYYKIFPPASSFLYLGIIGILIKFKIEVHPLIMLIGVFGLGFLHWIFLYMPECIKLHEKETGEKTNISELLKNSINDIN